tara:strand:- start:288 stop:530 length:243 start_codon:yes stop_codon:yes gene_type:complete
MVKLTKTQATQWNGNGFGNSSADWVVKGRENIAVRKLGGLWFALDTNEFALIKGVKISKKIAAAQTKNELLDLLETKMEG